MRAFANLQFSQEKIVFTIAGLPETFHATTPVTHNPPVIQPYTRLMNRAFSTEIAAGPKTRLSNDWLPADDGPTPQL